MFLKKLFKTSNASRQVSKLTSSWFEKKAAKVLTYRRYSNAGRGLTGRTVVFTKSRFLTRVRKPAINYKHRLRCLSFITTFRLIPFENKLVSLVITYPGFLTYLPATETAKIFQFMYFPVTNPRIKALFRRPTFSLFYYLRKLTLVSLLELTPGSGIKYARSAGTSAKVLKLDPATHTALVQLPSRVRKMFSLYSLVSVGAVALKEKRLLSNTRSGY